MLNFLIKKGYGLIYSKQQTIMSAAVVIAIMYGLSAFLGLVKNRLLASYFGDSPELGIYIGADRIPSFMLTLLTAGAFSAAFIPVFNKEFKEDRQKAWDTASSVLNTLFVLFLIIAVAVFVYSVEISKYVIGFDSSLTSEQILLMADLTRIMMLAQIVFVVSNFLTSVLQVFNRFILAAAAPVVYNIGVIASIVLLTNDLGIHAPAYGMIFGSILHLLIQVPYVNKLGFSYSFKFNFKDKGVRQIFRLAVPRTVGQTAPQFLQLVYSNLALYISATSLVIWKFAGDLQGVPVRLFGLSIGQAALPIFSEVYHRHGMESFKKILVKTISQVLYFVAPVSVLLFVLRIPLVRLAYGTKLFSWESTVMTSYALAFFSISICAQAMIGVLSKAFFTLYDTKTPLYVSLSTIFVNTILAFLFIRYFDLGVWSLAFAYAFASILDSLLLSVLLLKKIGGLDLEPFFIAINKIGWASLLTGIALYVPLKLMDQIIFDTTRTINLIVLTSIVSVIGAIVYLSMSAYLKLEEFNLVIQSLNKIKQKLGLFKDPNKSNI